LVRGETAWLTFPIAVAREILLGATIGYAFGLLMIPARIAGEFLTQELGMSLGSLVNAAGDGMASPLAVLFEMIAAAVFWGLDGHHAFFMVMHGMFVQMPVGAVNIEAPAQHALQAATRTEEWGLMLAAPLAACMFLATIGLTLLGRVAPQLNLYNFGLPMKLGLGLAALLLLLPQTVAALVSLFGHGTSMMGRMAG
jgi:flagellar biosynthesis protein FliR